MKVKASTIDGAHYAWLVKCPACDDIHMLTNWTFNGDKDRPTFTPSLLVQYRNEGIEARCHSFITDGRVAYLSDCTHALAGQTVDLLEWVDP